MTTLANQENLTNIGCNGDNKIGCNDMSNNRTNIKQNKFERFLANISNNLALSHMVNFK